LFSVSLVWAQISPFVAFQFYNGAHSEILKLFLVISFVIWAVLNLAFFCTIDLNYIHTFFSTETAAQYTVGLYTNATDDMLKFDAAFTNRKRFTKAIQGEIKEWVRLNIDRWRLEEQDWFKVALIYNDFLPIEVYEAEGGARRRRSSMSLREVVGLAAAPAEENSNNQLVTTNNTTQIISLNNEDWIRLAEELYATRSSNHKSNFIHINRIFDENPDMLAGLTSRCPKFNVILSFLLEDRFGLSVKKVDWTKRLESWDEEDLKRVGCSVATFLRKRKTGDAAMDAWRLEYAQLGTLFREVEGFESFMLLLFNNLLRDSIYGMVMRVSIGAGLSLVDAGTDISVLISYYSAGLNTQANILLAMIAANMAAQILVVIALYSKKSWQRKLYEVVITVTFLRPPVDAYRVSTNQIDDELSVNPLSEMVSDKRREPQPAHSLATTNPKTNPTQPTQMFNKGTELACESIPGCILQCWVFLGNSEQAGFFAALSIIISALTTGYSSAMISFDMDVDLPHRKVQPNFYGYVPDDHGVRSRTFMLMTAISAIHNLSLSVGCAMLALADMDLLLTFVGGEIAVFLAVKMLRGDFM